LGFSAIAWAINPSAASFRPVWQASRSAQQSADDHALRRSNFKPALIAAARRYGELFEDVPQVAAFVARATALASDRLRLAKPPCARMAASPLCDAPRFARALEAAYCGMWRRCWRSDQKPEGFDVADAGGA
jgi:hypothetical protein